MALRFPSIPEPGNDPATQLNTLRVIKQVVELLAANATGDRNPSGPGVGAQIFALQDDVKRLIQQQSVAINAQIEQNQAGLTWTVDEALADLTADIADARNRAIRARADALAALDEFEASVAQTVWEFHSAVDGVSASVTEEAGARATEDKAQAGRITKAAAYIGLNEATWKEGDLSVATRFNAMSTGYKEYTARTGDDFLASYTSHVVTTTDFTSAVTTKLDQLEAKLTVPSTPGRNPLLLSSAILTESNLTTDATKKIATAQNLQTTIASLSDVEGQNGATTNGAITAAVKVESDARVKLVNGVDGALDTKLKNIYSTAQYSVAVTTTGPAGPAITGFRAVSDSSSSTPISDFQIFADKFKITNGTTSRQIFSVDTTTNLVAIDGNLIVSGTIDSAQIRSGAVSTLGFVSGTGTQTIKVAVRPLAGVQIIAVYNSGDTATSSERFANFDNTDTTNAPSRALFSVMGNVTIRRYECYDVGFTTEVPGTRIDKVMAVMGYLSSTYVVGDGFIGTYPNFTYFHRKYFTYTTLAANDIAYFRNAGNTTKYIVYQITTDFTAVNGYSISVTELAR